MPAILQYFERAFRARSQPPRALLIAVSLVLLALIGATDYRTGFNLSFSVFYLLDIGFAAWFIGTRFALVLSALSIAVSLAADWAAGEQYSTINKDTRALVKHAIQMASDLQKGAKPETNSTDYNNGVKVVPTDLRPPQLVTKDNAAEWYANEPTLERLTK